MKITFEIYYHTRWGESLFLSGDIDELGANEDNRAVMMDYQGDGLWRYTMELPASAKKFHYEYLVKSGEGIRREWGSPHSFSPGRSAGEYRLVDRWRDVPADLPFYSSAFIQGIFFRQHADSVVETIEPGTLTVKVDASQLRPDERLVMVGDCPELGDWDVLKAPLLNDSAFPEWQISLDGRQLKFPFEYKFVIVRTHQREVVAWETGENRICREKPQNPSEAVVVSGLRFNGSESQWRGAGTAIPVFSLRTDYGFGIGEFIDLKYLVDWALRTGQSFIQLLPVNDTTMSGTWQDSYPYNANSTFALHPQYLRLSEVGYLNDEVEQACFDALREELNRLPDVDYERVNRAKMEYLRLLFEEQGEATLSSDGFKAFFRDNSFWLRPYAAFCSLRDRFGTADFSCWEEHSFYDESAIADYCAVWSPWYKSVALYYYIQYHLHVQLSEVKEYAHRAGVVLKGDIPIGISRTSVDAWVNPKLFHMDSQAGAPPDDFSIEGQNWGFPTYNWEVMARDGYAWWKARLRKMSEYFDAYRIDHILGFFRIWEIPMHAVHGLLGQFDPSLPMSREEIESYGLTFRDEYLLPFIHESFLGQLFGPHTHLVKQDFLESVDNSGLYRMKPGFETQREVEQFFIGRNDEDSVWIREGLYSLISNVLFVADKKEEGKYHPRIGVQRDFVFRSLNEEEKNAFNRLYDQYYYHRHNEFWYQQAMKKLPQLTQSTRMLVCGEDLGMIPACVSSVMNDLRILSLEIQRMPKNPMYEFGHLNEYPYRSVCTISTHDMSTLRGWWEEDYQQTQRYYNATLGHYGVAPTTATPELCEEIVRNHLNSNSILCILSFQDWLSIDGKWRNPNVAEERINVPSNPRNYWRYRMHLTLEQLMKAKTLNDKISELIKYTGRDPNK